MARVNQNFLKLPGGYLFPEIGRRVRAFSAQNPPMPLIRLGIGDVTQPLAPAVVDASRATVPFAQLKDELAAAGQERNLDIRIQREDIFDAMHRI